MKRYFIGLTTILFFAGQNLTAGSIKADTLKRKFGFHLMLSTKPIVNWLGKTDSTDHFFYSKVQLELQFSFKRHTIGIGLNGGYNLYTTLTNGLPYHTKRSRYFFAPTYCYLLHSEKRWKYYGGFSYLRGYDQTLFTIQSPIETITKSNTTIEEGSSVFLRVNYRLRRHLSIELETALFFTKIRNEYFEDYPLTPSLNNSRPVHYDARTYAFPSNLYLKYSF